MRRSSSPWLAAAVSITMLTACSESPTVPSKLLTPGHARGDVISSVWADHAEGTTADGAQYALYRPTNWNGDVVYYAHGIVDPQLPIALPSGDDAGPIRDALGEKGFAVAYSSFSENGYDFADGLRRTHQLRGIFTSTYGKPNRSFLLGHSLGGQIVQSLAEQYPSQYDGAVALCGVVGGTRKQINYIGDVRTMFDLMYPNWLPGTSTDNMPVVPGPADVQNAALFALSTDGFAGLGKIASIDQTHLAGRNAPELTQTLITALVYHARGLNDFVDRAHGHLLFDNSNTVYTSPVSAALAGFVNGSIARYTASPDANAWLDNNYEPTGNLRIPMLTLHNIHDPVVPFDHEAAYLAKATNAGSSANLRQRARNEYGHCNFGAALTASTVQDLVNWVTTGAPPAP
jgi:pimeloyl-ACP methyl ester carboxylesterase